MRNSPSLALLLALMLLLHEPVTAHNWQGTGTISNDKLSFMWNYIQSNLQNAGSISGQLKVFNDGLSAALNTAYDPAWNTVTAKIIYNDYAQNDMIVYGYAFKDQWMWFNGYRQPNTGFTFSFIVWKDYNCQTWKNLGFGAAIADQSTGFDTQQKAVISEWISSLQAKASQLLNDPWGAAKSLIDTIQGSTYFVNDNDRAYSVIMQQQYYGSNEIRTRLCVVGQEFYDLRRDYSQQMLVTVEGVNYGRFILFRTR